MILITTLLKQKEEYEDESIFEVPVCGSNFKTPVIDQAFYIGESSLQNRRPNVHRER